MLANKYKAPSIKISAFLISLVCRNDNKQATNNIVIVGIIYTFIKILDRILTIKRTASNN